MSKNKKLFKSADIYKSTFKDEILKIRQLDNEDCNLFNILGCSNNELRHSRFLSWLLTDNEFFKRFIEKCGIDPGNIDIETDRTINIEESYNVKEIINYAIDEDYYTENETRRRIDINIIGENYTITIENKVDTGEHDDQCLSYYNYIKSKYGDKTNYFVFLCKNEPQDFTDLGGLKPDIDLIQNYEDNKFLDILQKNLNKKSNKKSDNITLKFYNYRLITYTDIKDEILNGYEYNRNNLDEFNKMFANNVINQYKTMIDSWNTLQENYCNVFDNIIMSEKATAFYEIVDNIKNLKVNEENSIFGRFLEVAELYYNQKKNKDDQKINKVLNEMVKDNIDIKGNYANAIEIYGKNKIPKIKPIMNTIDYTAPMYGNSNLQVAFYAGLSGKLSMPLWNKILNNQNKNIVENQFIVNYNALSAKDAVKKIEILITKGTGFAWQNFYRQEINLAKFLEYCEQDMGIFNPMKVGTITLDDLSKDENLQKFNKSKELIKKINIFEGVKDEDVDKEIEKLEEAIVNYFFSAVDAESNKSLGDAIKKLKEGKIKNKTKRMTVMFPISIIFNINPNLEDIDLALEFYNKTLKGMKLFGYEEYINKIFKSEEEIKNIIQTVND